MSEMTPADVPRDLVLAAAWALADFPETDDGDGTAEVAVMLAAVLPLHEQQVRAAVAAELEAHAESIGWYEDGSVWAEALDVIRQAPWVRAARGASDA